MGHIHLGVLPSSKSWRSVVETLTTNRSDADILAATATAIEGELRSAPQDPIFLECIMLLAALPQAARSEDFAGALLVRNVPVSDQLDLLGLITSLGRYLDERSMELSTRTDFGELSRRALLSTISDVVGSSLPGLFDATPEDVRIAVRQLSRSGGFAAFARTFFGSLVSGTVSAYLDRRLALHVGEGQRFATLEDRSEFDRGLSQYAVEATRIIKEFAGGWYGKTVYQDGGVDRISATRFGAVALKKIVEEMQRKRQFDA